MVGEAAGHRPRRAHHVAVVAAPQRLGGVERGVVGERHERILQLGPGARVRVDVAGGHAPDPQPPGVRGQRAVAGTIVAGIRALQLHVQALRAERVQQPPRRPARPRRRWPIEPSARRSPSGRRGPRRGRSPPARPPTAPLRSRRAAPSRVCAWASVMIRQRLLQPRSSRTSSVSGGVRPCAATPAGASRTSISAPWIARTPLSGRALRQLHRAGDRVVVGQRERRVTQLARALRQLLGQRDAVQERVCRVAVQLDVWRA